jgi:hypothetical protein
MSRLAAAAAALVLMVGAGSAVAAEKFRVGAWNGAAHADRNGNFSQCSIQTEYENGVDLYFLLTRQLDFIVLLASRAWSLTEGDSYPVVYSIDGAQRVRATAKVLNKYTVGIPLPSNRETFDSFRAGSAFLVEAAGGRFRFDLAGTSAALGALLECVHSHLRTAGPSGRNPFSGEERARPEQRSERPAPRSDGGARQPPQASPEARARAAAFVEKLLLRAELYSYEILTGEQVPPAFRPFAVVWRGFHVIGLLEIVPPGVYRSADDAANDTIETDRQNCEGKYTSKGRALRLDDGRRLVQVTTACVAKKSGYVDFTVMPVAEGGFYRIVHVSSADPDAGRAANDRIGVALPLMLTGK